MSAKQIKVPKGWRKLRKGAIIRHGDKWLVDAPSLWKPTLSEGDFVNLATYIRRLPKKRASK